LDCAAATELHALRTQSRGSSPGITVASAYAVAPATTATTAPGLVAEGRSYRLISRELGLSKNTVADIVRRKRAASASL
jgi:DNA-binding NarL/FixJ family response regulator